MQFRIFWIRAFSTAALLILSVSAVVAAPIQHTYNFTASGFGPGAPIDPIVGSITATFDQAAVGSGIVDAISLSTATHSFSVAETGFSSLGNGVIFGGLSCSTSCMLFGTDDFWLYIADFSNVSSAAGIFAYIDPQLGFFVSTPLQITIGNKVSEPSVLGLIALGLFGIIATRKRKQA